MKKIIYLLAIALLVQMFYSCTPQAITENNLNPQSCCGDDLHNPPSSSSGTGGG